MTTGSRLDDPRNMDTHAIEQFNERAQYVRILPPPTEFSLAWRVVTIDGRTRATGSSTPFLLDRAELWEARIHAIVGGESVGSFTDEQKAWLCE